ncbi:MAG: beta-galactosidase [Patescibacteria group bacterium]|nr:beta-galactosidase [Patescibacteria group bacterium]
MTKLGIFFGKLNRWLKFLAVVLILIGIWSSLFSLNYAPTHTEYGVTFSDKYAKDLGLDWQSAYLAMLDELKVNNVRLIAYWDDIEATQDNFDFTNLDWQVSEASKRNVNIILAVGRRAPRWPECHDPAWLSNLAVTAIEQQQLDFIQRVINRYKDNPLIKNWQVENEPLFGWFGNCPKPSKIFLTQEVDSVRLNDSRQIILTDSGELNTWQGAASRSDILGITMYRIVWNNYLGFWDYWFVPPAIYHFKAEITKWFHPNLQKIIVTELQMEPWTLNKRMVDLTYDEQLQSFSLRRFNDNISYVKKAGFSDVYFWGVEYWYWLSQQGHPELWQQAKTLWQ